ncbi:MAG: hypothetical protein VX309_09785 [Pseudomonadota bacterium]|nr:hypothetical protein [Pseudomonadota bacterium]
MSYDLFTRDLANKAADDAAQAINRTMALHPSLSGKTLIAIMAAGNAMAIPAGMVAAQSSGSPEEVVEALWQRLRPVILQATTDAMKGANHG